MVKNIHKLNVWGMRIQREDCIFTNQRREQKKEELYGYGKRRHFVEDYPNKPTPNDMKRRCKAKALTTIRI